MNIGFVVNDIATEEPAYTTTGSRWQPSIVVTRRG